MELTEKQTVKELMIKYGFAAPDMTVTEFVEDILPPAQPEPCEDAVSRQAIMKHYNSGEFLHVNHVSRNNLLDFIEQLPSVTPKAGQPKCKTGKWIKIMDGNAYRDECNQCSEIYPNAYEYNFCPNCGARMTV